MTSSDSKEEALDKRVAVISLVSGKFLCILFLPGMLTIWYQLYSMYFFSLAAKVEFFLNNEK